MNPQAPRWRRPGLLRWVLVFSVWWQAAGYLFGPASITSSATLSVIRATGISFHTWGVVYLIVGLVLVVRPVAGHWTAMVLYGWWTLCIGATLFTGAISGWSAPAWALTITAAHYVVLSQVLVTDRRT